MIDDETPEFDKHLTTLFSEKVLGFDIDKARAGD
jgi:hypothetical protein